MEKHADIHEVAVVGAGPLGLEMAVALQEAGIDYVHYEARQIGSTIQWWAPGTRWFSSTERIAISGVPLQVPSQEKASREEYLAYLRAIVDQFGLDVQTYRRVVGIRKQDGIFELEIASTLNEATPHEFCRTRKIILTTGGTEAPNLLQIPGENLPHVSHYFGDVHTYFRKRVLIVGGRNSAVEAALRCHRAGVQVAFSYRREHVPKDSIKYWLYPEFSALAKTGAIEAHWSTMPVRITPTHVTLRRIDGTEFEVPADFVLLLTGYVADMSLCKMAGVTLLGEQTAPTFNPETMETNVPGIYIAGTATAGTQHGYKVFLENCHVHVERILAHLSGRSAASPAAAPKFENPES